ncbi:MAG: hypothetical protein K6A64_04875 [Bacteroidales bacterium]|nr:hypothetical protein [Bacteroidales bacterium]
MKRLVYFMAISTLLLAVACGKEEGNGGTDNGKGEDGKTTEAKDYSNTTDFVLVDMGLSVKWASMNLGASASWEVGDYCVLSNETLSGNLSQGGVTTLRLPTKAEWEEFYLGCRKMSTAVNGMNGLLFTSRTNGNAIFLPCAGYQYTYPSLGYSNVGEQAHYWSSTFYIDNGSTLYYSLIGSWNGMDAVGGTLGFSHHPIEFDHLPVRLVN